MKTSYCPFCGAPAGEAHDEGCPNDTHVSEDRDG
jgi:hypothetical protein